MYIDGKGLRICGVLVQFGCYQHRMNVKAPIYMHMRLYLNYWSV